MKKIFARCCISVIFPAILFLASCINDADDCLCTTEFRMITVIVVDSAGNPVTGLTATVKDNAGKIYTFINDPHIFPGHYTVMDDSYVMELSTLPKRFIFSGVKDSMSVSSEYLICTDECNCHVSKVSGIDTLILK